MKNEKEKKDELLDLTKSEVVARRILRRIHCHDADHGGTLIEITGAQGSGKTSAMLSFMAYTLKHYPQEKVFWSSTYNAPLQFPKIIQHQPPGEDTYHIMVLKKSGVSFHDRDNGLKQIHPPVTTFTDFDDCFKKAKPGMCNAVFFGDRMMWIDYIHYLRSVGQWVHVFIDELSEIAPAFTGGKTWKKIRDFSNDLKEARKCMMTIVCNTQSVTDIDHRVRTKVMIKVYLPGARSDTTSRITQKALDNLDEDLIHGHEAYLEYGGKFGRNKFRDIYKPIPRIHWEARVDGQ